MLTWRQLHIAVILLLTLAVTTEAGMITGVRELTGPGLGGGSVFGPMTIAANNDPDPPFSPNFLLIGLPNLLRFDEANVADIVFDVQDSGGTTEYRAPTFIDNGTPVPWSAFVFELGFGTGTDFVQAGTVPLDFDLPNPEPVVPPDVSDSILHLSDRIVLAKHVAAHPDDMPLQIFGLAIDVPDSSDLTGAPQIAGGYSFTLRSRPLLRSPRDIPGGGPAVPEPATLATTVAMLTVLLGRGRRYRH